ncbi:AMP-binding protein [Yinghuangia soli]|uniref:AMP-binding protein n=1 Tax=Yinghuangia soli TaxID=2908204 RepID=A0AA41QBF6_9ACTN|nr:AMP-binding protein [Yinghuangia soli]MCF2533697.1 AMP-binding protein [Yinghuangia soli]
MTLRNSYPPLEVPDVSLQEFVLGRAEALGPHCDRTALVCAATGRSVTYGELLDGADRIAAGLAARGVGRGDVAAVFAPNSPAYPVVFFGILTAGAAATTANALYTPGELGYQLRDSGARVLFTVHAALERARAAVSQDGVRVTEIVLMDAAPATAGPASLGSAAGTVIETALADWLADRTTLTPQVTVHGDDLAVLPYSSGTTGRPKGVMLTHRNLVANTLQSLPLGRLDEGSVALAVLPLFHIYGITAIMSMTLYRRASVVTMPRFDLEALLSAIQEHRVDHVSVAPPLALVLAKHPAVDAYDLRSVAIVLSAAAPLSAEVAEAVQKRLGCTVLQGFGLTESSPALLGIPHDRPEIDRGSVGVLLPGVEARLVDPATGTDAAPGAAGELWCRGPNIMSGYLGNPTATAEVLDADGYLHTGDLVTVDAHGVFHVVDRLKELIKYHGYQVAPAELEAVLLTHPGIADAAVIGVLDADGQEVPMAFVVRAPVSPGPAHELPDLPGGPELLDEEAVMAYVAARLAPQKKVRRVAFLDAIPKSAAGKILRRELRALPEAGAAAPHEH